MPEQASKNDGQPPRRPPLSSYGNPVKTAEQVITNNGW